MSLKIPAAAPARARLERGCLPRGRAQREARARTLSPRWNVSGRVELRRLRADVTQRAHLARDAVAIGMARVAAGQVERADERGGAIRVAGAEGFLREQTDASAAGIDATLARGAVA